MRFGKYETTKELGKGSFGTVYKASDSNSGEIVALKTVKNYDPNSTIAEVSILKQVKHKQIIQYIEHFFSKDGNLCIVMEFANRGALETDRVNREEHNVWRFMSLISEALNYLHTLKPSHVLHRDLKPANILGKDKWSESKKENLVDWKIADFGIAKLLDRNAQGRYYAGTCAGTPIYMAPEVLQNFDKYSFPADIWSFGAVVYFFISRQHLFTSHAQVMAWTTRAKLLPRSYSRELTEIILKMLDPNPKLRLTAQEVLNETNKDNRKRIEL